MGVIRKESTLATSAAYIGAALGFVNKIVLLPRFFDLDQVGLINISVNLAMMLAQFSMLGYPNIAVKYFPYFKDKANKHNGFLTLGLVFGLVGFVFMSLLFFIFREPILAHLNVNSKLLVDYYYLIFIIGLFFLAFNIYAYYLQALFKTYVVSLIRDVGLRLMVTLSITLYATELVSFEEFVWIFTGLNCSIAFFLVAYVIWLRQNFITFKISPTLRKGLKGIVLYGILIFLSNASYYVIVSVDSIMVADMVSLNKAGIYTTYLFVTTFMLFPYRALVGITSPQIGEHWKNNDVPAIQKLYKRTSFLGMLFGLLLFFGIWINRHNIVKLTTPEFAGAELTLLLLALTRLIDIVSGLNSYILTTSRMFRYDVGFNLFLLVMAIVLNIYFIDIYGMDGAAIATLIANGSFQIGRVIFLYFTYKLNPLDSRMLLLLLFGGVAFGVDFLIPVFDPYLLDLLARSVSFAVIYGTLVYFSKVSPDMNKFVTLIRNKIFS